MNKSFSNWTKHHQICTRTRCWTFNALLKCPLACRYSKSFQHDNEEWSAKNADFATVMVSKVTHLERSPNEHIIYQALTVTYYIALTTLKVLVKIRPVVLKNSLLIGRPQKKIKNKETRNAWQIRAYGPLGAVVSPPSKCLWNTLIYWSPECLCRFLPSRPKTYRNSLRDFCG